MVRRNAYPALLVCAVLLGCREKSAPTPYWTLLTLALEAKDFAEIARLLTLVEARFDLRFDAIEQEKSYAEFVKSPEYAKWLAMRMDEAPQE